MLGTAIMLTAIAALIPVLLHGDIPRSDIRTNLPVKKIIGFRKQIPRFTHSQVKSVKILTGTTFAGFGVRIRDEYGRDIILSAGINFPLGRPSAPYSYTEEGETALRFITERRQVTVPTANGDDLPTGLVVLIPGEAKPLQNYWQGPSYIPHEVRIVRSPAELRSVRTGITVHSLVTFSTLGMTIRAIETPVQSAMGEGYLDEEGRLYITIGSGELRKEGGSTSAVFVLLWTGPAS